MAEQHLLPADASAFAESLFAHLPRVDQRRWARTYLRGLLDTPGRKSVRELAARASGPGSAADALRQFVNLSPWDWQPARGRLARWVEERAEVRAWTLGQAIVPKRGGHSCGVHRRFVPGLGRIVNCQAALGLFLTTRDADFPVDWRLALPEDWGSDERLRERARIPVAETPRPQWRQALELIEQAGADTRRPAPPVYADRDILAGSSEAHDTALLAAELGRTGTEFVLEIAADLPVLPLPAQGQEAAGQPGPAARAGRPLAAGRGLRSDPARGGRPRRVRLTAGSGAVGESPHPVYTLFDAETHERGAQPRIVLTNLESSAARRILEVSGHRGGATAALSSLADEGLHDFEGRSYPGWHRHMTLVSAAYSYRRLGRLD